MAAPLPSRFGDSKENKYNNIPYRIELRLSSVWLAILFT
jgi:hypothetical protein